MASGSDTTKQPIPGYHILHKLGQGGMGTVYKARQVSMDRIVALKILPKKLAKEDEFKQRFFREARAAGALSHGNIVSAIDASEAGGYCYLAMEFVDGECLADRLEREGALDEKEALDIVLHIAEGLSHAWEAGIIHRDVKPENVLISSEGVAKLCDLGIAKAPADAGLTQEGMAVGTPRYISPEQAQALPNIDFRADIYSLGASLFHMIAGEAPYDGPSGPAIMLKHITDPVPSLKKVAPGISEHTAALVARMMAKDPNDRYTDPVSLVEDLRRARDGAPISKPKSARGKRQRITKTRKRNTTARRPVRSSTRRIAAVKARQHNNSQTMLIIAAVLIVFLVVAMMLFRKKNSTPNVVPATANPPAVSPVTPQPQPTVPVSTVPMQNENQPETIETTTPDEPEAPAEPSPVTHAPVLPEDAKQWPGRQYGSPLAYMAGWNAYNGTPVKQLFTLNGDVRFDTRGALVFNGGHVRVNGVEDKIYTYAHSRNQICMEVVFQPANLHQKGPARILTYSKSPFERNFTLGQEGRDIVLRLRTPETGANGNNPELTLYTMTSTELLHLIFTCGHNGLNTYANGELVLTMSRREFKNDFSNWSKEGMEVLLGNEQGGKRPWHGTIYAVGLYTKPLRNSDIKRHFEVMQPLLEDIDEAR